MVDLFFGKVSGDESEFQLLLMAKDEQWRYLECGLFSVERRAKVMRSLEVSILGKGGWEKEELWLLLVGR